jgi:hypothetical protein
LKSTTQPVPMVGAPTRPPDPLPPNPRRLWPLRALLVALGLVVPLLLLEGFLRVAGAIVPGDYQTTSFLEAHPEFGRRNRPGAGWKRTDEFTSWIEVNSKGLRGPEVEYAKPPGETRVLVLGDSFVFAEQVNQDETFTQRLQDGLNAGGGDRFRVLNGGSNGWSTANELIYLAKEGVKFDPDVVVLAFYVGNDLSDNYRRITAVRDAEQADLALRGVDAFEGPRRALRRSMLYTVVETGVLAKLPWWQSEAQVEGDRKSAPRTAEQAQEAWEITESLLHRMRQISENRGAKFVVMIIPSVTEVVTQAEAAQSGGAGELDDEDDEVPGMEDPHGTLAEIADRLNLDMLDLLTPFRDRTLHSDERLFYRVNAHWTAAGHNLAAEELRSFLTDQRLLPPPS